MSSAPTVTIVTDRAHIPLSAGDQAYADAMESMGCHVVPVSWNDPAWRQTGGPTASDVIVFRSPWDIWEQPGRHLEFLSLLDHLEHHAKCVLNHPDVLRWGLDKETISDLTPLGLNVPPSLQVSGVSDALSTMRAKGWSQSVIKPSNGGSGFGVALLDNARENKIQLPEIDGSWLLQPFYPEIAKGELNLVLIDGEPSHMIRKVPAENEWRSNWKFKPTWTLEPIAPKVAEAARKVMKRFSEPPLYARVDGIMVDNAFLLLEVEVVSPSLFIPFYPEAAHLLATATLRHING
ncbi:MAG: hypothetical protein CML99_10010 [Rhodobiaceae bacterium]|nr:hypothetical protein [Rhodobiaceae bacterium]|tara:strand:- start:191 stop:1066 length:876 start_codon:yes stop_codon:yes gene_type:complete